MTKGGKGFLLGLGVSLVVLLSAMGGALADRVFVIKPLNKIIDRKQEVLFTEGQVRVVDEESMVIEVVEKNKKAVVTVTVVGKTQGGVVFGHFDAFELGIKEGETETVEQDIGTGFVVDEENGLVITNRHVVAQSGVEYKVVGYDGTEYEVVNKYKDPVNDMAILEIKGKGDLEEIILGDSSSLKVGQRVVAIGTALGEFRQTVTSGVISGLGRGIEAVDGLAGYVEEIEDVIQTDAAINPGNSGGPLLNSVGEVIGVSVAVAGGAENIGFAIPINVIKDSLSNFKETGGFNRAGLGVVYKMIDEDVAKLNEVPTGAYVVDVLVDSVADRAGIENGDIIMEMDGGKVIEAKGGLAGLVGVHKAGDKVSLKIWSEDGEWEIEVVLSNLEGI